MSRLARAAILPLPLAAAMLLAGCANPDRLLFVTSTSVGLGYDATTLTGHLGFDRQEAYVGPDYPKEKGALPPVTAALQSDLDWFSPKIAQFYATGDAALIATGKIATHIEVDTAKLTENDPACALNRGCSWSAADDRRLSIVATSTHVGLVVTTKDAAVSKLDFGYGRQEVSLLPLGTETVTAGGVTTHKDYFPSVFAAINVNGAGESGSQTKAITGLPLTQFFATGAAADALAATGPVQNAFTQTAKAAADSQVNTLKRSVNLTDDQIKQANIADRAAVDEANKQSANLVKQVIGCDPAAECRLTAENRTALSAAADKIAGDAVAQSDVKGLANNAAITTASQLKNWFALHSSQRAALARAVGLQP